MDKEILRIIRHNVSLMKIEIDDEGFVYDNKLGLERTKFLPYDKFKIQTRYDDGGRKIRAYQGHTDPWFFGKEEILGMVPITLENLPEICIHGTYYKNINQIKKEGLCRMKRVHIHMVDNVNCDKKYEAFIHIDIEQCIKDGIPFYRSLNKFILSSGPIPAQYITKIVLNEYPVVIEVSAGSRNKYEYDHESGKLVLDRVLHSACFYPYDYGFMQDTLCGDGDALDVLVINTSPLVPGCMVYVRPLGYLVMEDEKGQDEKVLAVSSRDPHWDHYFTLDDVPKHKLEEITQFFQTYKALEKNKWVKVGEWKNTEATYDLISNLRT